MNSDELEDLVIRRLAPYKSERFVTGGTVSRHTQKSPLFAAPFGTTATTSPPPPMTTAELLAHMEEVLKTIPECPIKTMMKANGFDPDKGDVLVLPSAFKADLGRMPLYVRFSDCVTSPILVRNMAIGRE